jgi:hypothetical protein
MNVHPLRGVRDETYFEENRRLSGTEVTRFCKFKDESA